MANRKLQSTPSPQTLTSLAEIDRTLKKVAEGLEIFHETLEKLDIASTPAQKEKVEVELKKEIKKLQRLRDLIKGWQAMSELKDKQAINEARRSIELEMEKFKVLEKEMKIKAYSKEGLSQAAKLDPRELEKLKVAQWINTAVDRLSTQNDALETELEGLQMAARKTKRLDSDKQERLDILPETVERHKMHIKRLEQLLRFMENDKYGPEEVNSIKDDVEYYIDANQEPDFIPDEQLYDQFGELADEEDEDDYDHSDSDDSESEDQVPSPPAVSKPKAAPPIIVAPSSAETVLSPPLIKRKSSGSLTESKSASLSAAASSSTLKVKNASSSTKSSASSVQMPSVSMPVIFSPAIAPTLPKVAGPSFASAISGAILTTAVQSKPSVTSKPKRLPVICLPGPYDELYTMIQRRKEASGTKQRTASELLTVLESSYVHCPDGSEMERSRTFTPKQPFTVPSYYPSHPPPILENPAIFERFELDTLFFIFYYQQKTYAQYLAARELKRQSWRFHKKYLTWFQRHEEPKTITDEFEQGTYIYFDYEGNWCQRKKSEFTFEYRYLEDEETV
ncbi:Not CCR4-Not complex component domain-containing protein [Paramicrosporidium saccamoebae]|uniref:General negative regulator of transcription subunit n=1 Tax=Paramicrosporidium saccamoebae TaxID=1246581 RepID=A0A2H9TQK0_9FUNG|nr:Not CCR4-Not complex component domain-containing protein [Paramicrosporidium saccamoebae]